MGHDRRKLAFAFRPDLAFDVFSADRMRQFAQLCDTRDATPLENFKDARASEILPAVDILVTGWGCP